MHSMLAPSTPSGTIIIYSLSSRVPYVEAGICLSLAFDGMAFLIILTVTLDPFSHEVMSITRVIRRDSIMYFFAIFSSNLVWFVLLLHGRVSIPFC